MAKVVKLGNGNYMAELNQKELNTIALLLGYSSDELVKDRADDWEVPHTHISLGSGLTELYYKFYKYITNIAKPF